MNDLISRKALREEIESEIYWGMASHGAILQAIDDAPAVNPLPCKIGDTVWASGKQNKKPYIRQGVVSEMMYLEDMRLGIVVKFLPRYSHRGFWGVSIFATREECEAALGGKDNDNK